MSKERVDALMDWRIKLMAVSSSAIPCLECKKKMIETIEKIENHIKELEGVC